jgi:2-methylcitrate dehydratase PrpD
MALKAALRDLGLAAGKSRIAGDDEFWTPFAAALINGAAAHSLDFDDTHARSEIHPGAPIIPAALAAAEIVGADTKALLTGIVAGYEVMSRVAEGLSPTARPDRGFHITGIAGVFGAAAVAGNILRLTPQQMANAFGTALSQSAGSRQFMINGAWTKRFHVGNAAAAGLMAAMLARHDYSGAIDALEGKYGFFALYSGAPRPEAAIADLRSTWEILAVGIKTYSCCRAIHAALDGAQELRSGQHIEASAIRSIRVGLAQKSFDLTAVPQDVKRAPVTAVDCQFSTHFCVASMFALGRVSFDEFESLTTDPEIRSLMQRTDVYVEPRAEAEYPQRFSGLVEIEMEDGRKLTKFVRTPSGEPETMLSEAQLRDKFSALVSPTLGVAGEADLFAAIGRMTEGYPTARLLDLMQPPAIREKLRAQGGA